MAARRVEREKRREANASDRIPMRLSRKEANRMLRECDITPLEVMFANMTFWHKQSARLAEQIQELVEDARVLPQKSKLKAQTMTELNRAMRDFLAARENAQRCACDAAPYVHPKLQSIRLNDADKEKELIEVTMALTLPTHEEGEEPVDAESEPGREYRKDYVAVQPVRRDTEAA